MNKPADEKTVLVSIRLPLDMVSKINTYAHDKGMKKKSIHELALQQYFKTNKPKG